jgi:hypothetical protein
MTIAAQPDSILISDQRNGRWVLLGSDHMKAIEQRIMQTAFDRAATRPDPPLIDLKGLQVPLQFAFLVTDILEDFANGNDPEAQQHAIPECVLTIRSGPQGLELSNQSVDVSITRREAAKRAELMRIELEKQSASEVRRGKIHTVVASSDHGRWVLQGGDAILLSPEQAEVLSADSAAGTTDRIASCSHGELTIFLDRQTGDCVALTPAELCLCPQP